MLSRKPGTEYSLIHFHGVNAWLKVNLGFYFLIAYSLKLSFFRYIAAKFKWLLKDSPGLGFSLVTC